MRAWKEHGRRGLARAAAGIVTDVVPAPDVDCLVGVPGDPVRAWERGDVPSQGLADELGVAWRIGVLHGLERRQSLRRQRGLSLDERRRNARGSVAACSALPPRVCVVDDVYTSGATADACAAAAKRAGARAVSVVTFARAVR